MIIEHEINGLLFQEQRTYRIYRNPQSRKAGNIILFTSEMSLFIKNMRLAKEKQKAGDPDNRFYVFPDVSKLKSPDEIHEDSINQLGDDDEATFLIYHIDHEISKLQDEDVEGHVWWNKFREFVANHFKNEGKEMSEEETARDEINRHLNA